MPLAIQINTQALAPRCKAAAGAFGGVEPYVFSVVPGGAGGSIDPVTGLYTAPAVYGFDIVRVTDNNGATADVRVLVASALELFCDILRRELNLENDQVYLWDQKFQPPKDTRLYIAVGVVSSKPFGNGNYPDGSGPGLSQDQSVNMQATLSVDIFSRGVSALQRREEVLMALTSWYSKSQQETNSFYIAPLTTTFVNISELDGAAIPYRFSLAVNIQYMVRKVSPQPYFDTFNAPQIELEQ
jgi:hypothetical protein